jgi:hypothetical protein
MEENNKFSDKLHQANSLYVKAEECEKNEEYANAKKYYTQAAQFFEDVSKDSGIKNLDSMESMKLISESCKRKIKILDIKQTLLPKYVG